MNKAGSSIAALVPTYRRPDILRKCLEGFAKQTRQADELLVVVRDTDGETRAALDELSRIAPNTRILTVSAPGQVAALNLALSEFRSDILAITDDDAVPRPDWLERIGEHFARDPRLGGLGGRDHTWANGVPDEGKVTVFGKIDWWGRPVGLTHVSSGPPREAEILKGANMSYRGTAIQGLRFDSRLWGAGAEAGNDVAFGLAVKRAGWGLLVDPAVIVDHYPAEKMDYDKRGSFSRQAMIDQGHNQTLILMDHLGSVRRIVFVLWAVLLGMRVHPGILQWVRLELGGDPEAFSKLTATLSGRTAGLRTWWRARNRRPTATAWSETRDPA